MKNQGFSLVELLVTIAVAIILFSIGTINVFSNLHKNQMGDRLIEIKASLYTAQSQTLNRIITSVRFEPDRWVIFRGETYNEDNPSNQVYQLTGELQFDSINLVNQEVIFDSITGEVKNFSLPANITLTNNQSGKQILITINRLGTVEWQ